MMFVRLLNLSKQKTVPNVFVDGKHIGGSTEALKIFKNHKPLKEKHLNIESAPAS